MTLASLLPSFSAADIETYLRRANYNLPPAFVERITEKSCGNPLFLREYLALLHARGQVSFGNGESTRASVWVEQEVAITAFLTPSSPSPGRSVPGRRG